MFNFGLQAMVFNEAQAAIATGAFLKAEQLAGRHFRKSQEAMSAHRYDVKTRAFLDQHEVNGKAFAHLCKYAYGKKGVEDRGIHFYRVCLQDDRILDAVRRADPFIRLSPLMLYIAAHELVHVIRFESGEADFDASREEKEREEEKVHEITRQMLLQAESPDMALVIDCFRSRYDIGDIV